jgi:hypothetical protein
VIDATSFFLILFKWLERYCNYLKIIGGCGFDGANLDMRVGLLVTVKVAPRNVSF